MNVDHELRQAIDDWYECLTTKSIGDAAAAKHTVEILVREQYQDYNKRRKVFDKIVRDIVDRLDFAAEAAKAKSSENFKNEEADRRTRVPN